MTVTKLDSSNFVVVAKKPAFGEKGSPSERKDRVIRRLAMEFFYDFASILKEPLCWTHEKLTLHSLSESTSKTYYGKYILLYGGFLPTGVLGAFGSSFSLLGWLLSKEISFWSVIASQFGYSPSASEAFSFSHNKAVPVGTPTNNQLSIFNWNICAIFGGFSLDKGGVGHWRERMPCIIEKIQMEDADVVVLEEVYDRAAAQAITKGIQDKYPFIFHTMGVNTLGAPSGILFASKYPVHDPQFTRFPIAHSIGWQMKLNGRGWFTGKIKVSDDKFIRLHCTHLQHSVKDTGPKQKEQAARAAQTKLMLERMEQEEDGVSEVFVGDLNMEKRELDKNLQGKGFQEDSKGPTCGRDDFVAQVRGLESSEKPVELDHILVRNGRINTEIIKPIKDSLQLSDHSILSSTIRV